MTTVTGNIQEWNGVGEIVSGTATFTPSVSYMVARTPAFLVGFEKTATIAPDGTFSVELDGVLMENIRSEWFGYTAVIEGVHRANGESRPFTRSVEIIVPTLDVPVDFAHCIVYGELPKQPFDYYERLIEQLGQSLAPYVAQAKAEVELAKTEAERARAEADRSGSLADRAATKAGNAATEAGNAAASAGNAAASAVASAASATKAAASAALVDAPAINAKIGASLVEAKAYTDHRGTFPGGSEFVTRGYYVDTAWAEGIRRVLSGAGDAKVLCIGDSTTFGSGASFADGWINKNSWPSFLAKNLDERVAPSERGLAIPPVGGGSGAAPNYRDSRWTLGADWSRGTDVGTGLGGRFSIYRGTIGASYLGFRDPEIVADRFDVYYLKSTTASLATLRAQVTGGTAVTATTGSQADSGIGVVTVTAPKLEANQLLRLSAETPGSASSACFIVGIEPWNSKERKIRVGNAGVSGSTSSDWLTQSARGDSWNVFGFIATYKPNLTIIDLGINDADPTSPLPNAQFIANVKRLADAAVAAGSSVLFKTMIPSREDRRPAEAGYVSALKAMSPRRAVLDTFRYYDYDKNVARGWMADHVHGNELLYADEGNVVASFLDRAGR